MTAAVPLEPLRLRTLSAAEQVVRVEASVVLQLLDVVDVDPVPRHRLAGRCSWSRSSRATIATASCVQARQPCGEQHQELVRQAHRAFEPAPGSVSCSAGKVYHCCVAKSTAAARFRPVANLLQQQQHLDPHRASSLKVPEAFAGYHFCLALPQNCPLL